MRLSLEIQPDSSAAENRSDVPPLRVGIVCSSVTRTAGGLGPVIWSHYRYLRTLGAEVSVRTLSDSYLAADAQGEYESSERAGPRWLGYSPTLFEDMRRQFATCDLIHAHGIWMYPTHAARKVADSLKIPFIISPHGMLDDWALRNSRWKKRMAGCLYANRDLRSAACIHALCESEYQSIRAYGLNNPVAVIPNGIELPRNEECTVPPWEGIILPGNRVMLFLGRIHPKKNIANLIQAWQRVKAQGWSLVIAGWSQLGHEEELKKLTADLSLNREVLFIGPAFDQKKEACLRHASAFILPSLSEGLPMSVLEAWSYGLPVVITKECNLPEGFAADAAIEVGRAINSIEEGLRSFFSLSDVDQQKMGDRGLHLVLNPFSWSIVSEKIHDTYSWVLGHGARPDFVRLD